jgi:hypothetical protein
MAKKRTNRLYLMVRDKDNIMDDFVWATHSELEMYRGKGYVRLNKK